MINITTLYLSRLNRYFIGNIPPIVCYAIGNKQFENCICDCKYVCKKTPGLNPGFNNLNYFDYEAALTKLKNK
jgi:hypothetical protein